MLSNVLNSLKFWVDSSSWTPAPNSTLSPTQFTNEARDSITAAVERLYNSSPTARDLLERLAGQGSINIGYREGNSGMRVYSPSALGSSGYFDSYILIDPSVVVKSIDNLGETFTFSLDVILAHEFAHWANGTIDPRYNRQTANADLNDSFYDYVGGTVPIERQITSELTYLDADHDGLRASYMAAWASGNQRAAAIEVRSSYTDGNHVDIVRLGDIEVNGNMSGSPTTSTCRTGSTAPAS